MTVQDRVTGKLREENETRRAPVGSSPGKVRWERSFWKNWEEFRKINITRSLNHFPCASQCFKGFASWIHLIPSPTLGKRYLDNPHFICKEMEAERVMPHDHRTFKEAPFRGWLGKCRIHLHLEGGIMRAGMRSKFTWIYDVIWGFKFPKAFVLSLKIFLKL